MSEVTNLDDSGPGSLRQAIADSNTDGTDITMSLFLSGTITLVTALTQLNNTYDIIFNSLVTIDINGLAMAFDTNTNSNTNRIYNAIFSNADSVLGDRSSGYMVRCRENHTLKFYNSTFKENSLTGDYQALLYLDSGGTVEFSECILSDLSYNSGHRRFIACVGTTSLHNLTINDCTLTNVGCIYARNRTSLTMKRNTWNNDTMPTPVMNTFCLWVGDTTAYADTDFIFTDNQISNTVATSGFLGVENFITSTDVQRNVFDSCASTGGTEHTSAMYYKNLKSGGHTIKYNYFVDCVSVGWLGACSFETDSVNTPDSFNLGANSWNNCSGGLDGAAFSLQQFLLTSGSIIISYNTFYNCHARRWGGGIRFTGNRSTVNFKANTFVNNKADDATQDNRGGAIRNEYGNLYMVNCLFWGNQRDSGGGGNLVSNTFNEYGAGSFSGNNNLMDTQDDSLSFTDGADGNMIGTGYNANVSAMADNGGLVPTCAIDNFSDAVDAGASDSWTKDARGFKRQMGDAPDIGAFELRRYAKVI